MLKKISGRIHIILQARGIYVNSCEYHEYISYDVGGGAIGLAKIDYSGRKVYDVFYVGSDRIASIGDPLYFEKVENSIMKLRGVVGCL